MTPKEKAQSLVDNFKGIVYPYIGSSMLTNEIDERVILRNAKVCATIEVDEIINLLSTLSKPEYTAFIVKDVYTITDTEYEGHAHGYELIEYFQQVKEEISNI